MSSLNTLEVNNKRCFDSRFFRQILTIDKIERIKAQLSEIVFICV